VIRLHEASLMWPELFKFGLKELAFLAGDRLLIQYQNVRYVVIADLISG
jgi:hypothetical protein